MLTVRCKSPPPLRWLTATAPTEDPSCPFSDFHNKSQKKKKKKRNVQMGHTALKKLVLLNWVS